MKSLRVLIVIICGILLISSGLYAKEKHGGNGHKNMDAYNGSWDKPSVEMGEEEEPSEVSEDGESSEGSEGEGEGDSEGGDGKKGKGGSKNAKLRKQVSKHLDSVSGKESGWSEQPQSMNEINNTYKNMRMEMTDGHRSDETALRSEYNEMLSQAESKGEKKEIRAELRDMLKEMKAEQRQERDQLRNEYKEQKREFRHGSGDPGDTDGPGTEEPAADSAPAEEPAVDGAPAEEPAVDGAPAEEPEVDGGQTDTETPAAPTLVPYGDKHLFGTQGELTDAEKAEVMEILGEEPADKWIIDAGSNNTATDTEAHSWETINYYSDSGELIGSKLIYNYTDNDGDIRTNTTWKDSDGDMVQFSIDPLDRSKPETW